MRFKFYLVTAVATSALALAGQALAGGFYVGDQSVKGLGRAYAGEAADTGADDLWWNPAAIAGLTRSEIVFGLQGESVSGTQSNTGSTITRPFQATTPVGGVSTAKNPTLSAVVPNFASAYRINDQWAVGLALTSPYSDTTKYASNSFARYDALTTKLLTIDVQPTLAWKPNRWLGLGVGFDAEYVKSTLSNALPNLSPLLPDGSQELQGNGWDYGFVVGGEAHPTSTLSLGVSYRSEIKHTLTGQVTVAGLYGPLAAANSSLSGKARFTTPDIATAAARWTFAPKLTLDAQVQRFGWSAFNAITITDIATTAATPENYRDTTNLSVGLEYALDAMWTVRTGMGYDETPTTNAVRSARVPDGNRWLYSLGLSAKPKSWLIVDAAVGYLDVQGSHLNYNDTQYSGTPVVTPVTLSGQTSNSDVITSIAAHVMF